MNNYYFHRLINIKRLVEIKYSKLQTASMGRDLALWLLSSINTNEKTGVSFTTHPFLTVGIWYLLHRIDILGYS